MQQRRSHRQAKRRRRLHPASIPARNRTRLPAIKFSRTLAAQLAVSTRLLRTSAYELLCGFAFSSARVESALSVTWMMEIVRWANANQGIISLITLIVALPTLLILLYRGARKLWPSREQRRVRAEQEFARAERMKKEVESRAEWDKVLHHYGVFLIRDIERRLPNTEEVHSSVTGLPTIAVLIDIHTEHLAFTHGASGIKSIKNIAGAWHFADEKDDEAIKVDMVSWLNYRDILLIRWETDEYWEWPQICCKFTSANKFPFSRVFFAEAKQGAEPPFHRLGREVCLLSDVFPKPK